LPLEDQPNLQHIDHFLVDEFAAHLQVGFEVLHLVEKQDALLNL